MVKIKKGIVVYYWEDGLEEVVNMIGSITNDNVTIEYFWKKYDEHDGEIRLPDNKDYNTFDLFNQAAKEAVEGK